MRIVAGDYGGLTLKAPSGNTTRPTSDRVRESVFNILVHRYGFEFQNCADFFAGTGALGLEALSRGAKNCLFFEEDKNALKCLKQNIETCGVASNAFKIIAQGEVFKWRTLLAESRDFTPLDLIFCDPPYNKKWVQKLATSLVDHPPSQSLFSDNCLWVCEVAKDDEMPKFSSWEIDNEKDFGDTRVFFLIRKV